eukprot:COSAG06_NODE_36997_length_440_cov_1.601173_1_plen_41_part_10
MANARFFSTTLRNNDVSAPLDRRRNRAGRYLRPSFGSCFGA